MQPSLHQNHPRSRVLHDTDDEIDAFNATFEELGLDWRWDRAVMREFAAIPIETARVAAYLRAHQPHLLKAYPAEFLAGLIVQTKAKLRASPQTMLHPSHHAHR